MFRRRTLFVLGAGASKEVEMPVGADLAKTIARKCDIRFDRGFEPVGSGDFALFDQFQRGREYQDAAWLIRDGVQLSSSIDDFLDMHRDNHSVKLFGNATIVKSILEAEQKSTLYFNRAKDEQTINITKNEATFKLLARGQPLANVEHIFDNVRFIVFNYDRCLEHFLVHALRNQYGIDESTAHEICSHAHIVHPYGSVGPLPIPGSLGVSFGASSSNCLKLASGIRTYTEQITDANELSAIRDEVLWAECIVFLGFAYHDQNMRLLTPNQKLEVMPVYGTAFGMSDDNTAVVTHQIAQMMKGGAGPAYGSVVKIKNSLKSAALLDDFAKSLAN
jgi:hypothetical protein